MALPKIKLLLGLLCLIFLAWIMAREGSDALALGVEQALAQGPRDSLFSSFATGLSIFLVIFNTIAFLVYPILTVVVDPVFFLEIYTLNQGVLHTLWQVSRNIMNVIFVFILIGVALVTVVTAKKDIIGKYAVKFVLAVILVNFSWFFPRVILDVGHVTAATVFKLTDVVQTQCRYLDIDGQSRPCRYAYDFRFFNDAQLLWNNRRHFGDPPYMCPTSITCFRAIPIGNLQNTPRGILSGLIMNHGRLPDLARAQQLMGGPVPAPGGDIRDEIRFILMFIANIFFTLALTVALMLAMIAMLVAFIIRIPVLWLTIAFMPFMFLGYVIGDVLPQQFNTKVIFEHFVKAAFLPAVVAIPLTVGFIIINVLANLPPPPNAFGLDNGAGIIPGVRNLWTLLWMITTILVIWKGFFLALKIDEIYAQATAGIQHFGANLGGIVKWLPMNLPFIPVGKDSKGKAKFGTLGMARGVVDSLAGMARTGTLTPEGIKQRFGVGADKAAKGGAPPLGGAPLPPADVDKIAKAIADGFSKGNVGHRALVNELQAYQKNPARAPDQVLKILSDHKEFNTFSPEQRRQIVEKLIDDNRKAFSLDGLAAGKRRTELLERIAKGI